MRFPTKPKPAILDESFLDEAPQRSIPAEPAGERSHPAGTEPDGGAKGRSRRRERQKPSTRPVEKPHPVLAPKTFRIPAALARRLEALALLTTKTQTQIVVEATETRVSELEDEYRRRTGQRVPSFEKVPLD